MIKGQRVYDRKFIGIRDGWRGLVDDDCFPLKRKHVMGLSKEGGTILGTSRTNPYEDIGGPDRVREVMRRHEMDAIIAIGGEGTLRAAKELYDDGINVLGVPKTIDNDLGATDYTFGFDTALSIATESIDRLRTTAESHHRCMVVEVMGRSVGWIALHAGMAAGAHATLVPEFPQSLDQITQWVLEARGRGRAPVVVVAEGFTLDGGDIVATGTDAFGRPRFGGIGTVLAPLIEEQTGIETRCTTLGHLQRGGAPTGYDRVLAARFGGAAMDNVVAEKWGTMVSLRGTDIVTVGLDEATRDVKAVPRERYDEAAILFG